MKFVIYLTLLYFFASCSSNTKVSADSGLPILDLTQDFPERELDIHEIAEVEYIPLETNDSSLIKMAAKIMISDKYIITYDFQGPVFIFDRKGKHIRSISHYGQGPKEHTHIFFVAADFKKEEYYVHTMNNKIIGVR